MLKPRPRIFKWCLYVYSRSLAVRRLRRLWRERSHVRQRHRELWEWMVLQTPLSQLEVKMPVLLLLSDSVQLTLPEDINCHQTKHSAFILSVFLNVFWKLSGTDQGDRTSGGCEAVGRLQFKRETTTGQEESVLKMAELFEKMLSNSWEETYRGWIVSLTVAKERWSFGMPTLSKK